MLDRSVSLSLLLSGDPLEVQVEIAVPSAQRAQTEEQSKLSPVTGDRLDPGLSRLCSLRIRRGTMSSESQKA